jgi:glycosyltransferase involved in cell wall biosynthesis
MPVKTRVEKLKAENRKWKQNNNSSPSFRISAFCFPNFSICFVTSPILHPPTPLVSPSAISDLPSPAEALRSLRICFLAGTLGQGGAERQLFYTLKCLKECRADVNLLTLTQDEHWEAPIRQLGVPIHFQGGINSRLGRLMRVFKTVRRVRPQVIQSQHFFTNIYAGVVGRILGCTSIGAVRNDAVSELEAHAWPLGRLSVRLPHWIAANSANALRNLKNLGLSGSRYLFLPNMVDTHHFRPAGASAAANEFTILSIGRLEPQKRFDVFLDTVSRLAEQSSRPIRAVIAGEGSLRRVLEEMASQKRRHGLAIKFVGKQSGVLPLYQSCDALLLASGWEGTPNVVMEAMACGLPVVATKVGGVGELVRNGETGFLFERDDPPVAIAALGRLAREPGLSQEIGTRARAYIERHHSVNLLPNILASLYAKTLPVR